MIMQPPESISLYIASYNFFIFFFLIVETFLIFLYRCLLLQTKRHDFLTNQLHLQKQIAQMHMCTFTQLKSYILAHNQIDSTGKYTNMHIHNQIRVHDKQASINQRKQKSIFSCHIFLNRIILRQQHCLSAQV